MRAWRRARVLCLAAGVLAPVAPIVGTVLRYQRILVIVVALPATRRWTRR